MKQTISILLIFICLTVLLRPSYAKRGCANYGHSCYGGHGKRSEVVEVFPRDEGPSYRELWEATRRESGMSADDAKDIESRPQYKLIKMIRQWLDEMRPPQKISDSNNMSNEMFKESVANSI